MQVILKVVSGPAAGRKFWLRPGDFTEVGSNTGVDFAVPDASMDRVHFTLECSHAECKLHNGEGEDSKPTLVNGDEVETAVIADGDEIKAGDSVFQVTIEGKPTAAAASGRTTDAWAKIVVDKAAKICLLYELDASEQPLLESDPEPESYIAQLTEKQDWPAAIEFLAHAIPKREAIWWTCLMIRECGKEPGPKQEAAIAGAETWVRDPNEDNRRAALDLSDNAGLTTPWGLAAMAVYYSGGSLTPPDVDPVEPEETLTPRICNGALILCSVQDDPGAEKAFLSKIVAAGIEIAQGAETWKD